MAKTFYYQSSRGLGELTGIRETDKAVDDTELARIDAEAMHRVNALIVRIAGVTTGGALVAAWMVDGADMPSYIVLMAEKLAAAEVWHRWEQYNLGVNARDDANTRRDSERLADEVRDMSKTLADGGVIVDDDGSVILLAGGDVARGPVVGGPAKNGSYFDDTGYYDSQNRRWPARHTDPFKEV